MENLLVLVRQKLYLEQDLIFIKVRIGPEEKNEKYHCTILMNITGNSHNGIEDWQFTSIE